MLPESPATSHGATAPEAALVTRLAQMLETARIHSDRDYEVTKRMVAEASSLSVVGLDGRVIGADPDAAIRFQLLRDQAICRYR